jgi:hypothetical protein
MTTKVLVSPFQRSFQRLFCFTFPTVFPTAFFAHTHLAVLLPLSLSLSPLSLSCLGLGLVFFLDLSSSWTSIFLGPVLSLSLSLFSGLDLVFVFAFVLAFVFAFVFVLAFVLVLPCPGLISVCLCLYPAVSCLILSCLVDSIFDPPFTPTLTLTPYPHTPRQAVIEVQIAANSASNTPVLDCLHASRLVSRIDSFSM